jgi:hypothetical protein
MDMTERRQPHILNAASNLLGICFVLITAIKLSGSSDSTYLDEVCILAALGFMISCLLSFYSIRNPVNTDRVELFADYIFFSAMILLFFAVLLYARHII